MMATLGVTLSLWMAVPALAAYPESGFSDFESGQAVVKDGGKCRGFTGLEFMAYEDGTYELDKFKVQRKRDGDYKTVAEHATKVRSFDTTFSFFHGYGWDLTVSRTGKSSNFRIVSNQDVFNSSGQQVYTTDTEKRSFDGETCKH